LSGQVVGGIHVIDLFLFYFFFFQAEDGIRDRTVTGVQTCALPISPQVLVHRQPGAKSSTHSPEGRHTPSTPAKRSAIAMRCPEMPPSALSSSPFSRPAPWPPG